MLGSPQLPLPQVPVTEFPGYRTLPWLPDRDTERDPRFPATPFDEVLRMRQGLVRVAAGSPRRRLSKSLQPVQSPVQCTLSRVPGYWQLNGLLDLVWRKKGKEQNL